MDLFKLRGTYPKKRFSFDILIFLFILLINLNKIVIICSWEFFKPIILSKAYKFLFGLYILWIYTKSIGFKSSILYVMNVVCMLLD